ncbi:hypothetical protein M5689_019418 [Euphorbia peplus]|nr:hypothetical protein M5689_019418 [Euphorbia peplus]
MSCLNLRLPPAKKAWKSFTSKLQNKLHKLNKSKNIKKKTRHHFNTSTISTKSVPIRPSLSSDHSKKKRFFNPFKPRRTRKRLFLVNGKKTAPVYIDRLFVGPVAADQEVVVTCPARVKTVKVAEFEHKEDGKGSERDGHGDDMWESLGFASPQMRGINERAEQFIASFRAELEVQELIDGDLCKDNATS